LLVEVQVVPAKAVAVVLVEQFFLAVLLHLLDQHIL
jgi:hypothetical protein